MKEIFRVTIQIIDRGVTYPMQDPIEVHPPVYANVKKYLDEARYSMDMTKKYKFKILSTKLSGYGKI